MFIVSDCKELEMTATIFLLMYALPYLSCMDENGSDFDFFDEVAMKLRQKVFRVKAALITKN